MHCGVGLCNCAVSAHGPDVWGFCVDCSASLKHEYKYTAYGSSRSIEPLFGASSCHDHIVVNAHDFYAMPHLLYCSKDNHNRNDITHIDNKDQICNDNYRQFLLCWLSKDSPISCLPPELIWESQAFLAPIPLRKRHCRAYYLCGRKDTEHLLPFQASLLHTNAYNRVEGIVVVYRQLTVHDYQTPYVPYLRWLEDAEHRYYADLHGRDQYVYTQTVRLLMDIFRQARCSCKYITTILLVNKDVVELEVHQRDKGIYGALRLTTKVNTYNSTSDLVCQFIRDYLEHTGKSSPPHGVLLLPEVIVGAHLGTASNGPIH